MQRTHTDNERTDRETRRPDLPDAQQTMDRIGQQVDSMSISNHDKEKLKNAFAEIVLGLYAVKAR